MADPSRKKTGTCPKCGGSAAFWVESTGPGRHRVIGVCQAGFPCWWAGEAPPEVRKAFEEDLDLSPDDEEKPEPTKD